MALINTKSTTSVAGAVSALFADMFPKTKPVWLETLFRDVDAAYKGRHPDYLPCDLRYHDLEHSLQATLCYAQLMFARHQAGTKPQVTPRQFELGVAAALLHDIGYLKLRGDKKGTGAKYNYIHVLRSCAFAAAYLPTLGVNLNDIQGVLGAINCTGPTSEVARMHFHDSTERLIGCAVATADYVGQMAASDYPDELGLLYREFEESNDYTHMPKSARAFKSVRDLTARTPDFWRQVVLPKLEHNFGSLHRFLTEPYVTGELNYLDAIERNIAEIRRRARGQPRRATKQVKSSAETQTTGITF